MENVYHLVWMAECLGDGFKYFLMFTPISDGLKLPTRWDFHQKHLLNHLFPSKDESWMSCSNMWPMCWHNRDKIKVMFLQRWWCLRRSGKLGVFSKGLVNGTQNPIFLGGWVKLGEDVVQGQWWWFSLQFDIVDGRNPAPVDRQGFSTSQVVQDSSINSMFFESFKWFPPN